MEALWCHSLYLGCTNTFWNMFFHLCRSLFGFMCRNPQSNHSTESRGQRFIFGKGQISAKFNPLSLWFWQKSVVATVSTSVLCSGLLFPHPCQNISVLCIHPQISSSRVLVTLSPFLPSSPNFKRFYWPNCIYSQFIPSPIFWQLEACTIINRDFTFTWGNKISAELIQLWIKPQYLNILIIANVYRNLTHAPIQVTHWGRHHY